MSAPALPGPAPTVVLKPEAPPLEPLSRWVWLLLSLGLVGRGVTIAMGRDVAWAWQPPLVLAGCLIGYWAEERAFYRRHHQSGTRRGLWLLLQGQAWLPALVAAAMLNSLPGAGAVLGVVLATAGAWFASASWGSWATLVVDWVLSRTRTRFRTRLSLAIFTMMVLSVLAGLVAGSAALWLMTSVSMEGTLDGLELDVGEGGRLLSGAEATAWLREHVGLVFAFFSGLAAIIGVPSWLSSAGKLADAAMYRLRPLARAFDEVAEGTRDVRVEEAGSLDFIALNQKFNAMVQALGQAERMEDAFGRYVSKKVLERIRAQHGEAVIPAQLRNATVFFADVRGYTALSERLSPEAVVSLLNRYLAKVVDLVEQHEGYLNKFIGDAVVVVFNGPVEQADHAERAVRCALELQAMVKRENVSGTFAEAGELKVGIGVATGPMVCGNVGGPSQMEYTVIGDTVNLSARLTSAAGPAEVWVSEATAKGCKGVKLEPLPELKVKGKEKPVTPYRVSP